MKFINIVQFLLVAGMACAEGINDKIGEVNKQYINLADEMLKIDDINERISASNFLHESVSSWYPSIVINAIDVKAGLESDRIDNVIVDLHYSSLQNEIMRILKIEKHGNLDLNEARRIVSRRASSICGAYPVGLSLTTSETIKFIGLLVSYSRYDSDTVNRVLILNIARWNKEEKLAAIIFLKKSGQKGYESMLNKYNADVVKRLQIVYDSIKDTVKGVSSP